MKKVLASFLLLVVMAAMTMAAQPAAPTLYNNNDWSQPYGRNIYTSGNPTYGAYHASHSGTGSQDSMKGYDTLILLNKYPIAPGYQYIAQIYDSTGLLDTLRIRSQLYSMDGKYAQSDSALDSAQGTASAGQFLTINLPGSSVSYGGFLSLKIWKRTASLVTKIWRFELIQRRPYGKGIFGN